MESKYKLLIVVVAILVFIPLVSATYYPSGLGALESFPADINIEEPFNLTATYLFGNLHWINLTDYPVACPGSGAITQLNDSITCSDLWVDVTGDTMTGALYVNQNVNITGNITANQIYGSVNGFNIGPTALPNASIYFNISNISQGYINGMTYGTGNSLLIGHAGTYHIVSQFSFSGNANNEYHLSLGVNSVQQDMCHAERVIGTGGDIGSASYTCFIPLAVADEITPMIENVGASNAATIDNLQLTLLRIGD